MIITSEGYSRHLLIARQRRRSRSVSLEMSEAGREGKLLTYAKREKGNIFVQTKSVLKSERDKRNSIVPNQRIGEEEEKLEMCSE